MFTHSRDASSPRLVPCDLQRIPQDALDFLHLGQENAAKQEKAAAKRVAATRKAHTIPPPPRQVSDKSAGKVAYQKPRQTKASLETARATAIEALNTQAILDNLELTNQINSGEDLLAYLRERENQRVARRNAAALEEALAESSDDSSDDSSEESVAINYRAKLECVGRTGYKCRFCPMGTLKGRRSNGTWVTWCQYCSGSRNKRHR